MNDPDMDDPIDDVDLSKIADESANPNLTPPVIPNVGS